MFYYRNVNITFVLNSIYMSNQSNILRFPERFYPINKTWVSDHLAWATTLTWATVFSCTDAILVNFTYLELVIYLLNASIILLQNTKLTVNFTGDGRPYPHLTPHCRWPGQLLFMVGPWLTGTTGSQTPYGFLTIANLLALASLNVFLHVSKRKICSF